MAQEKLFPNLSRKPVAYLPTSGYLDSGEEFKFEILDGDQVYASFPDESLYPFKGHLNTIKIDMMTFNVLQGDAVQPSGKVHIHIRGFCAYGFTFADPLAALDKCRRVLEFLNTWTVISDWGTFPMDQLKDRRVYYREQPAIVKSWVGPEGKVMLVPDSDFIEVFRPEPWNLSLETFDAETPSIWLDLMDPHIHWFRE